MIAAIGKNRELGKNNGLLWHIPEDAKYFKDKTTGHAIIMGRKTFESFPKMLPNRVHIIVTHDKNYKVPEGCFVFDSIEKAIEFGKSIEKEELFIIGGAQIYALGMKYADKLYLTLVDAEFPDADAFFPEYKEFNKVISRKKSRDNNFEYEFVELEKGK